MPLYLLILTFKELKKKKKKTMLDFFSVMESPLPSLTGTEISIRNSGYEPMWLDIFPHVV